ncbi:MAG: hypothetical protein L6R35_004616 [Caloplaca aegaea]|nr:MAG: hypothetical protein L6R35_004616 [Caloplaca aegaea]
MISEIAIFEASDANVDLANPDSPYKANFEKHLKTVLASDGAQAAYYAQVIEKPHIIILFVNWDTLDSHINATKTPQFAAFESSFRTTLIKDSTPTTPTNVFHVPFKANMLDALQPQTLKSDSIGVTELVFASFHPSPRSQSAKDKIVDSFNHVEPFILRHGGLTGYRNGWALESLETPLFETKEGGGEVEGKGDRFDVYVNLTGWDKMETHVKFMETEDFRDNLHWYTDVEGGKGWEIVHGRFFEVGGR